MLRELPIRPEMDADRSQEIGAGFPSQGRENDPGSLSGRAYPAYSTDDLSHALEQIAWGLSTPQDTFTAPRIQQRTALCGKTGGT